MVRFVKATGEALIDCSRRKPDILKEKSEDIQQVATVKHELAKN